MDLELIPSHAEFRDEVRSFIRARLPEGIRERLQCGHSLRKSLFTIS